MSRPIGRPRKYRIVGTTSTTDARASSRHWVRLAALHRRGLISAEYARQILSDGEVQERLNEGVIERDPRIAARFAVLDRQRAIA